MLGRNIKERIQIPAIIGLVIIFLLPVSLSANHDNNDNNNKQAAVTPSSSARMLMVEGTIYDKLSGAPLSGVTVVLLNRSTQETIHVQTGDFGMYVMELAPNKVYELAFFKENYHLESSMFSSRGRGEGTIVQNWYLRKMSNIEIQSIDLSSDARIPSR